MDIRESLFLEIISLAKQISKLKNYQSSHDLDELSLALFEKALLLKNLAKDDFLQKESELKAQLDVNKLSFIPKDQSGNIQNNKQAITPLIETIKEMIPEMPENNLQSNLFEEDIQASKGKKNEEIIYKRNLKHKKLNDHFSEKLKIDLNDKSAFIQKLFDNKPKIYNKAIREIFNFKDWESARDFIEKKIQYKNNLWGKNPSIAKRFYELVKKQFE
ncbi:MAG: hypothetical protein CMC79_01560 [Flavobacteriaceae bacterium]|nr:hypothetical protein [Flavobacteriaceae bacterium]|tara:strand:+ start:1941 stop:2591 length:651 start_codon:yes stop_codon:yes gene_type:complete